MKSPSTEAPLTLHGVRTPEMVASCPVCQTTSLQGRQTVCSPACRAKRWRLQQAQRSRGRDDGLRAAVALAVRILQEALGKMDTP